MRVSCIKTNPEIYSSNVYLIRGNFNTLDDVNTLIDTGSDGYIISEIKSINTGAGKKSVDQVILTHLHFDHTGGINDLKINFNPTILAFNNEKYISKTIRDDEMVKAGESTLQVIHVPGHSFDSICLYNYEQKYLFTGDTPIEINSTDGTYTREFIAAFERLASLKVKSIFPGHGKIITENAENIIKRSYQNILLSKSYVKI